jgi:predicted nuclease of restriction endonuclease-like RecB superfamily
MMKMNEKKLRTELARLQAQLAALEAKPTAKPKAARKDVFRKGEKTYRCISCDHMTRRTKVQSIGSELCPDCYEIAGIYNLYCDYGADSEDFRREIPYLRDLIDNVVAKGGKLDSDARELLKVIK